MDAPHNDAKVQEPRWLRRWKRRGRIMAPFACVPLLLAMLLLSVDLIEYSPQDTRPKLVNQPISPDRHESGSFRDGRTAAISTSVIDADETAPLQASDVDTPTPDAIDPAPPTASQLRPPTPPYALRH